MEESEGGGLKIAEGGGGGLQKTERWKEDVKGSLDGTRNTVEIPRLDDFADFETYADCVEAWAFTTELSKTRQGFALAMSVPLESKRHGQKLRESLLVKLKPKSLVNDISGVDKVLEYLRSRLGVSENETAINAYHAFETFYRKKEQNIQDFIMEFEIRLDRVTECGMTYPDNIKSYRLFFAANLDSITIQLVKNCLNPRKDKNRMFDKLKNKIIDVMSNSLGCITKPIQEKNETFATEKVTETQLDVLVARGWKPPPRANGYQKVPNKTGREQNSYKYKNYNRQGGNNTERKNNPIGPDGTPLQCKVCKSIMHLIRDCPHSYENQKKNNKTKYNNVNATMHDQEYGPEETESLLDNYESSYYQSEDDSEGEQKCGVYITNKDELNTFTAESLNAGALDTACTQSIAGEKWLRIYLEAMPNEMKDRVVGPIESGKPFIFGNNETLIAECYYELPIRISGENMKISVDIVKSDIPLLISKGDMKKMGMTIDLKNDRCFMNGKPVDLGVTTAGHYTVDLLSDQIAKKDQILTVMQLVDLEKGTDKEQIAILNKIHRQMGHRPKRIFMQTLKEADKWQNKFSPMIDKIIDGCEGCILRKRAPDRPVVSYPMSSDFNQVVSMDIKVWDSNKNIYIVYLIDSFTRFTVAAITRKKTAAEVADVILTKWIPTFGIMGKIITDNGGEFVNEEIKELSSILNIKTNTTGAESPWQNGVNERNHAVNDVVLTSILRDNPDMKLEIALAWAVNAKNTMSNVHGYSPYLLVYGRLPRLPNILYDPPPCWEQPEHSKVLIETLEAIKSARIGFAKSERCERLTRALRAKMRNHERVYERGDYVYFKREGEEKWKGPAKVLWQDNKVIGVIQNGTMYKVSANRIIKAGEELATKIEEEKRGESSENKTDDVVIEIDEEETEEISEKLEELRLREREQTAREIEESDEREEETEDLEEIEDEESENEDQERRGRKRKRKNRKERQGLLLDEEGNIKNPEKILKRKDRIELKKDNVWKKGTIVRRAGKVGGIHEHWFNIRTDDGTIFHANLKETEVRYEQNISDENNQNDIQDMNQEENNVEIEDLEEDIEMETDETILLIEKRQAAYEEKKLMKRLPEEILAVMVPREQRNSEDCLKAKLEELEKLKEFNTYEIVEDQGQPRITTVWVLTEKGQEKRARLTCRGFLEEDDIPNSSPTVGKHTMKALLAIATTEGWDIKTTDIKSAFLQGNKLERDVYVKPPKELGLKNKLLKLNTCLYGLKDASRQWYFKVRDRLKSIGFEKSNYDAGLFYLIKNDRLIGIIALHVDDFLHAGSKFFNLKIMPKVLEVFKVGKSESREFMYTGFNLKQEIDGITLDQEGYVKGIEAPELDAKRLKNKEDKLDEDELTLLRRMVGILNWAVRATRPELSYEMIELATKFKGGKVEDLAKAKKVLGKLKTGASRIKIANLRDFKKCKIWMYSDAAFRNLNNKEDSCGGYLILIVNTESGECAPIEWSSAKLKRKVHSTLGAETLSLQAGIDAAVGLQRMLKEISNGVIDLKVKAITDNKSCRDSLYSENEVTERVLRGDIACIKQKIELGCVEEVRWIQGKDMLADILTKAGVNKIPIIEVLQEGKVSEDALQLIE